MSMIPFKKEVFSMKKENQKGLHFRVHLIFLLTLENSKTHASPGICSKLLTFLLSLRVFRLSCIETHLSVHLYTMFDLDSIRSPRIAVRGSLKCFCCMTSPKKLKYTCCSDKFREIVASLKRRAPSSH